MVPRTPMKKHSFSLPHTGHRVWKPTMVQFNALSKLATLKKPVHFREVCEAWNTVGGLSEFGYVTLKDGVEGTMVQITPNGRALCAAIKLDRSLLRTEPMTKRKAAPRG